MEGFLRFSYVNVSKDCSQGDELRIQRASTFIHPLDVVRVIKRGKKSRATILETKRKSQNYAVWPLWYTSKTSFIWRVKFYARSDLYSSFLFNYSPKLIDETLGCHYTCNTDTCDATLNHFRRLKWEVCLLFFRKTVPISDHSHFLVFIINFITTKA